MIHRYWTGPDEPEIDGPVWHDDDLPAEIAEWVDARMDRATPDDAARHRSNMVRWWLLWGHGGLWLDHDAVLHGKVPKGEWVAAVGVDACAAAVSLPAKHPLAAAMLDHFDSAAPSDLRAPLVSGRVPLTRLAQVHGVRFEQIPRPGQPATWISHEWATSQARNN